MNVHLPWRAVPGENADKKTSLRMFFYQRSSAFISVQKNKVSGSQVF